MNGPSICITPRSVHVHLFTGPGAGHDRGMLNVSRALTFRPATSRTLVDRNAVAATGPLTLSAGRVHRLYSPAHQPVVITATRGTIWLTHTPAEGDIILRTGEQLAISDGWPVVIQAITDAEVTAG